MSEERPKKSRAATIDGVRVLVVDDEPDARDLLQSLLAEAGAVVETADGAQRALEAIPRFRPDVLVSDIHMPGEDGHELVRRMKMLERTRGGDIPAIALSALAQPKDRARAIAAGFVAHVAKPVNVEALVAVIAVVVEARR